MLPTHRETRRWLTLTLATSLAALAMAALACAPIAPAGQGASATPSLVPSETEQQKPICTDETWFTDCIKPTFPPTDTPEPTPTIPLEIYGASGEDDDLPTATPVPLTDQVKKAVQDDDLDAIVRARVISHRRVTITPTEDNFIPHWTRSRLEITDILRGELPAAIDIVTPTFIPNAALDVNGDYILFLRKSFVDAESSQFPGDPTRTRLNQAELAEFGGEAYVYLGRQVWVVDGASVHKVPSKEHLLSEMTEVTDLAIAKANGETMMLAALERILRPGDNCSEKPTDHC